MEFDTRDRLALEQLKHRIQFLVERGAVVELTEKRRGGNVGKTLQQNRYLHVILGYFAKEYGETREYVKTVFFKKEWNPDIFLRTVSDPVLGREVTYLRSTGSLSKEEMTLAIERFRNHASADAGIYIPSAEEHSMVAAMEEAVRHYEQYL